MSIAIRLLHIVGVILTLSEDIVTETVYLGLEWWNLIFNTSISAVNDSQHHRIGIGLQIYVG